VQGTTNQAIRGGQTSGLLGDAEKDNTNYNQQSDMSRQEDFIDAGIQYRLKHGGPMAISGGTWAEMAHEMNRALPFEAGAEHGYQYAVEHSDDVIRLIVKMAKKDIAFTEEEAVKFYHEEMEE
jgi:hypothetical protein